MKNGLEYEYISEEKFSELVQTLYRKLAKSSVLKRDKWSPYVTQYEDTMVKIFTKQNYDEQPLAAALPYRVDRKRFRDSKDELLNKYPNIVFSMGKYPEDDLIVRYSEEVGYIIPHMKRLLEDDEYFKKEQFFFLLEN